MNKALSSRRDLSELTARQCAHAAGVSDRSVTVERANADAGQVTDSAAALGCEPQYVLLPRQHDSASPGSYLRLGRDARGCGKPHEVLALWPPAL